MSELFNWLEQSFTPLTGEKQLDFRLRIPVKKTLAVHSDIGLLKSVLMNLVSNAIKYTTEGTVLVSARQRGREVLLQIWDTGMGIPEECIESIFDEYYQVHNPQRDRTKGLGLGLPIAKRALALLDGEITCRSQVGHGSVFEFRLPLARASSRVAQGASEAAPGNVPKDTIDKLFMQGKRLVVVEDNVLVAQAMESYLKIMGAEVECFNSPEDTLHHADIEHTDFFIIDYMLGNTFNGMQLLDMLRQKSGKPIHAVLVTGDTSTAFIRNAKKCAWPVLHKPIDLPLLISSLREQC
jgi:CheY-like chemotaxis protein/anti-sigma regulatory factor (Ser/Thr protein kinase)